MLSNGEMQGELEPSHPGLSTLGGMCSALEGQYHRLRGEWRSISSIHRMQAVVIENQVLNMLGVRGTMVQGLNTETVEESPNLVQAAINLSQYENVFEEVTPFRVKGTGAQYAAVLGGVVAEEGALEKLTAGRPDSVYQPLVDYREARKKKEVEPLLTMLRDREILDDVRHHRFPILF